MNNTFYYKYVIENDNINGILDAFKNAGYKYIVKAEDRFLSGWGHAGNGKHIQLIGAINYEEAEAIKRDLYADKTFSYINWWSINDKQAIKQATRGKTYTIRNDWTRANTYTSKQTQAEHNEANKKAFILKDIFYNDVILGYREKDVINNLKSVDVVEVLDTHIVIRLTSNEGAMIDYDFITKKIVG